MAFDAMALEAAYKIEDLYAKPYIGGIAQRRAAIQCLIRDYLEKVETIRKKS